MTVSATLSTVTIAAVTASVSVDRIIAKAADVKADWAEFAARGITDKRLVLADVGQAIVVACQGRLTKAKAAHLGTVGACSEAGFGTAASWFYELRRVEAAGRLGELIGANRISLTKASRGTAPTTAKAKATATAKADKAKAPPVAPAAPLVQPALPAATFTLDQMASHLEAEAKRLSFKTLRAMQPELSRILQAVSIMHGKIDRGIRAEIKAEADAAAVKAANKAGRSSRRKAA